MLVVALCVIAVVSPLVALRWPAGLLLHRWRWPLLVWAVLAFQVVVLEVSMPTGLAAVLHVLTYVAAIGFLWMNRSIAGVWIVAAGSLLNGVVIALNGGTLPASASAVASAGLDPDMAFANSGILEDPVLPWLGDVFAWPAPMPLANTFSVGDVLIVAGVFVAAWTGTRRLGAGSGATAENADTPHHA
ncbi:DUF5317 domain-containing protein [Demequina oxidasica]|uniref:DUF5317 domain-containing protein n=1 Tax=Demequina oxidasica TaxID=676199 RepID=UPI000784AB1C|nr:DUF5317 domain-containing protein [Demequina oxidasica]